MTIRHRAKAVPFTQNTPEWLAWRLTGIGSSDAPVIAGERGNVLELWAEKAGLIEHEEPGEDLARLFEWGHRLEPVIADWYADHQGVKLRRVNRGLVHPDVPWAFASLDRVTAAKGIDRIVEIKTHRWGWRPEPGEAVPGFITTQVQHQLWVTGYELADVVVLTGGSEPTVHTIERDDEFIDNLVWLETEFRGWVETQTRPPVDGSETTRRVLGRLHRSDGTMIQPTLDLDRLFFDWQAAKVAKDLAADQADTLANALRAVIGDADGIEGRVTYKRNADSTRIDWPSVAKDYRGILDDLAGVDCIHLTQRMKEGAIDDLTTIESIHSRTTEGAPVLRSVWRGPQPGALTSVPAVETGEQS